MNRYSILDKIEQRPGMYLSRPGFGAICDFINGYDFALLYNQFAEQEQPPFSGFNDFVLKKLDKDWAIAPKVPGRIHPSLLSWERAIADAAPDDGEAMRIFFDFLRQYRHAT